MKSDYGSNIFDEPKADPIFDTPDFAELSDEMVILSKIIWSEGDKSIFFLCGPLRKGNEYLFQYIFRHKKVRVVKKIDRYERDLGLKTFQWIDKERALEIVYTDKKTEKEYIYYFFDFDDL